MSLRRRVLPSKTNLAFSGIFLVCSVYDFALMLKPVRKMSIVQDAMLN